jgi:hypothetical protein
MGGSFLDAKDFLNRFGPPGTRFDSRIIGHIADGAAVNFSDTSDHCIGGIALFSGIGEEPIFDPKARIQQACQPLPHQQSAFCLGTLPVAFGTSLPDLVDSCQYLLLRLHD